MPRLFLNHIAELDWLIALEFGRVDDGQPPENWVGVSPQFGYLHEQPGGRAVGFKILEFSQIDLEDEQLAAIWQPPLFDAPAAALTGACAGEIAAAARVMFAGESSPNRLYFNAATNPSLEAAGDSPDRAQQWRWCLQAGDCMAHFGLGCELHDRGEYREAYRHLRYYTEIAPHSSWNWCWLGKAAAALGEHEEARAAFKRAIDLTAAGQAETDAPALLATLGSGGNQPAEGWTRDDESARRVAQRTQKYSTAAKYSTEPPALLLGAYEYRENERLACPHCGWSGQAGEADRGFYEELFDVSCPRCEKMLLVVSYPTIEETRRAAAAGNDAAKRELPNIERMEARWARAAELALTPRSELPELDGGELEFVWDFEEADGEDWTVIRCGERLVWRELAYWEGWERFNEVKNILKGHYGVRFASIEPSSASTMYLYGDDLSAPSRLETS